MSRIRVDELINQGNSGPTLAVEGLRVPSTKSLVVEGIISLNGDTGLTGQVLSRTTTGVGWTNVPLTDNNTTYTLSTVDGANPATDKVIRLSAGGSGSGFTDVVLVAGNNVSLTRNSGRIIIDSSFTDTDTVTRVGAGGQNYTDGDINLVGTGAATITQSGRTFTINVNDENTTYVGESGVTVTADNKIKIGQPVGPTDPVTFQQVTVSGNLIVQGTTTTSNSVTVTTLDKFINLNDVLIPTDAVADGGGIRLKGDSDHTILWSNVDDSWTSSEHFNIASGREYKIDGDEVITATSLGNGVRQSSLESVGVLSAGRWEAQTIGIPYGGTGHTNANDALNAFLPVQAANSGKYLTTDGQDTSWAAIPPTYNGWSIGDNSVTAQVNSNDIVRVIGTGSALVTMDNVQKRLTINADNTTYNLTVENQQQPNRKSIRLTDNTGYAEEVILSAGTGVTLTRTNNRLEFSVAQDLSTSAVPTFTALNITGGVNATTYTGSGAQLEGLTGVPNGVYGSSAVIPVISVDPSGRITNISTAPNTGAAGAGGIIAGGNDYSIQYNNNGGFAGSDKIKFEPIQGELTLKGYLVSDNIVSTGATITELQALDYIKFPSKNTSERDYLNVLNGSVVYNNDDDQLQMYQDGQWLPVGGIRNIGDLLDVDLSTPAGDGQILSYSASGGRWVPTTITTSGSVQQNSSLFVQNNTTPLGSGNLDFNSATNVLTYTPPDITNFITTEVDPLFTASPASGILLSHITNWTQAYNWGDHSSVGYLQATNTEKATWNEAYSWGNHASAGYLTAEVDTLDSVTGRGATTINNITVGQLTAGGLTYPNANGTIGQVLTSDGAGNVTWQNAATGSGGSGAQQLDQLTDVSLTTPTSGQVLYFNGTNWTNGASSGGSGSSTFLGLTDTPASMGSAGQVLAVNSGGTALEFISAATGGANVTISDNPPANPNSGDLWWESDAGRLKIRYSNVWVDANPAGGTSSGGGSYADGDVDSHLNRSTATTGQVLSWNGTDYAWVANSSSASGSSTGIQMGIVTQLANAFGNTNTLKFGNDMSMYHMQDGVHGTSNWIVVDEHNLYIGTKGEGGGNLYTGIITVDVGNDAYTNNSAHVKLGYGGGATGGTRLETTSSGVSVTGHGTFNGSVLCSTDGTHDLGQSSVRWRTLYADSVNTGSLIAGGLTYPTTNGTSGQVLTSDGSGNVTWSTVSGGGGGSSTFSGLTDTPSSMGTSGQYLAVNSAGTALEYVAAPSGGGMQALGSSAYKIIGLESWTSVHAAPLLFTQANDDTVGGGNQATWLQNYVDDINAVSANAAATITSVATGGHSAFTSDATLQTAIRNAVGSNAGSTAITNAQFVIAPSANETHTVDGTSYPVMGKLYVPTGLSASSIDVVVVFHGTVTTSGSSTIADAAATALTEFIDQNGVNARDKIIFSVAYPQDHISNTRQFNISGVGTETSTFLMGDNLPYARAAIGWVKNSLNAYIAAQGGSKTINDVYLFGHSQGGKLVTKMNTLETGIAGVIANAPGPIQFDQTCSADPGNTSCSKVAAVHGASNLDTLDSITNSGATTTNTIRVGKLEIGSVSQSIVISGSNDLTFQNTTTGGAVKLRAAGEVEIQSYQGSTLLRTNTGAGTIGGLSLYYATGLTTEVVRLSTTATGVSISGDVDCDSGLKVDGKLDLNGAVYEKVKNSFGTNISPTAGVLDIDTTQATVFVGQLGGSVTTWNFTNVSLGFNETAAITVTLVLNANSLYTYGDLVQIDGTAVSSGVLWSGGIAPISTNNDDILTFTIITDESGNVRVYGAATLNYS